MTLSVVVEGDTDLPYVRKLASDAGLDVQLEIDANGKHQVDLWFAGYNGAAQGSPWLVVRDLDHDAPCAGEFLRKFYQQGRFAPNRWMRHRIAVREVEAWLLADAEAVAAYFSVRPSQIPTDPEAEHDPTRTLVDLCRTSRKPRIRADMVPAPGKRVSVGPLYETRIIEFGRDHWDVTRAATRSRSLQRAQTRLRELATEWHAYAAGTR